MAEIIDTSNCLDKSVISLKSSMISEKTIDELRGSIQMGDSISNISYSSRTSENELKRINAVQELLSSR